MVVTVLPPGIESLQMVPILPHTAVFYQISRREATCPAIRHFYKPSRRRIPSLTLSDKPSLFNHSLQRQIRPPKDKIRLAAGGNLPDSVYHMQGSGRVRRRRRNRILKRYS